MTINAEIEKAEEILEDSAEGQRLRFLENEIHKTNLKLMEGDTIKKKYTSILDMLKKERLTFSNQLEVRLFKIPPEISFTRLEFRISLIGYL